MAVTKPEHELEVGKYYTIVNNGDTKNIPIICKIINNKITKCNEDKNLLCYGAIIQPNIVSHLAYSSNTDFCYYSDNRTYRESTSDEIEWLDRCIAANKFVPKELTKDELLEIAKQKYPVGTVFIDCEFGDTVRVLDNSGGYMSYDISTNSINTYTTLGKTGNLNFNDVYSNGKWAEIVEKPNTTSFTTDFKWESKSPANTMAERMNINSTYGIMNGGNVCNEIILPNSTTDIPRLTTENTTDEILKILNQYMEIEILDTMEEVVLPQLLKSK